LLRIAKAKRQRSLLVRRTLDQELRRRIPSSKCGIAVMRSQSESLSIIPQCYADGRASRIPYLFRENPIQPFPDEPLLRRGAKKLEACIV
jgi:hypothetical protein